MAQRVSFGVVTGTSLLDDFPSGTVFLPCFITYPGQICPSAIIFSSQDASRRFIIGPKLELRLSNPFSLEAEALHRAVRQKDRVQYIPFLDLGNGVTIASQDHSGTDYTWEFPVLANYKFPLFETSSFVEVGPTFRPAENNEQNGITAGAGVELRARNLNIAPRIRFTHWLEDRNYGRDPVYRLGRPRRNQIELLAGIVQPSSSPAWATAFGQELSLGLEIGFGVTDDFHSTTYLLQGIPASRSFSESRSRVVGVMVGFEPLKNLFIEVSGLYRPLHLTDENLISIPEEGTRPGQKLTVTVLTWEFPLLAKFKLRATGVRPFVELGPSFRATGNLNAKNPSHYGVAGGVGAEMSRRKMRISPTLRYTRWATDQNLGTRTNRNQLEVLIGLSF